MYERVWLYVHISSKTNEAHMRLSRDFFLIGIYIFPGIPQHSRNVVLFPRIEEPPTPPCHETVKLRIGPLWWRISLVVKDIPLWIGWLLRELPSQLEQRHSLNCPVLYGNPGSPADQWLFSAIFLAYHTFFFCWPNLPPVSLTNLIPQ